MDFRKYDPLIKEAIKHYWNTLASQAARQSAGDADRGGRSAVTGGKQMDQFCKLVSTVLRDAGLGDADIYLNDKLDLPGYFRPTKKWDLLVVSRGRLIAAMEFKSQRGPSFGNNFNNRSEEAIGTATDLWTAHRDGAFGKDALRPWLGWVMLLEECPASTASVAVKEPHFPVFKEFVGASYAQRYELLLRKLVKERLYDSAAFLLATPAGGPKGEFREPAQDMTMRALLASLAGHVGVYIATR